MKDNTDKRTMNVHATIVVVNETKVAKAIKEKADSRAGCANHLGEGFLTHLRDERHGFGFLAEVGHQQKKASEAFLAGVE